MQNSDHRYEELLAENAELRARLEEAEECIRAIREGEVDALVVSGPQGEQIYTLRGAEHTYRILVEAMSEGALVLTPDGSIAYSNSTFAAMLGVPLDRVLGSCFLDHVAEESVEAARNLITRDDGTTRRAEVRLKRYGAPSTTPALLSFRNLELSEGEVVSAVVTDLSERERIEAQLAEYRMRLEETVERRTHELTDNIAELKHAQGQLSESEQRFRTMADAMPQLAWMADPDGYIFWYNKRWYDYTGTTPEQMEGWGWQSVHDPEMLPSVLERWKGSIATGEPFDMEFPLRGTDGRFRWFLTRVLPVKDSEGHVTRWFGTNTDVSERWETEEALREQARMLDLVHVLVRDLDGRIMFWNKGAEVLYGYTSEEAVGRTSHELFKTRFPVPLEEIMSVLLSGGEWEGELGHTTKDGSELAIASHWVLHRDKDGNPAAVIETNNDVTQLKRAEEELRKLNTELEQRVDERTSDLQISNRELENAYKEMQTLSYSLMHDLRTPLRAIGGFSDALLKHQAESLDERGQDYLQRIATAAQMMSRIIDDIHDLLRAMRAQLQRQNVDMSAMALEVVGELRKSDPLRSAEIRIEQGLTVNADPNLLRVVLDNLLGNAWKFTGKRPQTSIEVGSFEQNGERVYLVRDNGVGFDPAYMVKLFQPFQRLHKDPDFSGTGMGLALVQRIVRRHGGDVWAEGEVDKGATFYFTLGTAAPCSGSAAMPHSGESNK